jgi:hypothetical protein
VIGDVTFGENVIARSRTSMAARSATTHASGLSSSPAGGPHRRELQDPEPCLHLQRSRDRDGSSATEDVHQRQVPSRDNRDVYGAGATGASCAPPWRELRRVGAVIGGGSASPRAGFGSRHLGVEPGRRGRDPARPLEASESCVSTDHLAVES